MTASSLSFLFDSRKTRRCLKSDRGLLTLRGLPSHIVADERLGFVPAVASIAPNSGRRWGTSRIVVTHEV